MGPKQILFATLILILPLNSFATKFYLATEDLNVRSGPGTTYTISFTLRKGDEVELLSQSNDWYHIFYSGKTGYAHSNYLIYSRTLPETIENTKSQPETAPYLFMAVLIVVLLFVVRTIYKKLRDKTLLESVTKVNRGTRSERDLVLRLLKYGVSAQYIFHDLYVEKYKGAFSQIDIAVITKVGIIVFEVKDYSGWIFGSETQTKWTQVLAYGKQKHSFYNPIMQNNKHIAELRKQLLPIAKMPFYSIIVFYGNSVLKDISFVTNETFLVKSENALDALKLILRDKPPVNYLNEPAMLQVLRQAVINGGIQANQVQHRENIKSMLSRNRIAQ